MTQPRQAYRTPLPGLIQLPGMIRRSVRGFTGFTLAATTLATVVSAATAQTSPQALELLGEATIPGGTLLVDSTEVGGLSGITYDAANDIYFVISDDRSQNAPARFYSVSLDLNQPQFGNDQVQFQSLSLLRDMGGQTYPSLSLDPEGIVLSERNTLWISSEGDAERGIAPFVQEFRQGGDMLRALPLPDKLLPDPARQRGIGQNLALESLTLTPGYRYLFTATENALRQDGPEASLTAGSLSRIFKYDLVDEAWVGEYIYQTDPVVSAPNPANGFTASGLVELLALDGEGQRFLALERSFSAGAVGTPGDTGLTVRLYEVDLTRATDVSEIESLKSVEPTTIQLAEKKLLLDLTDLGIPLDNLEGLTFGPTLPDGRRSLILVSDNNFNKTQFTQFLVFAIAP